MKSTVAAARLIELVHMRAVVVRRDPRTGLPGVIHLKGRVPAGVCWLAVISLQRVAAPPARHGEPS